MTQDDRMETINDPAEIRATSDERGCCDCRTFDQHERECIPLTDLAQELDMARQNLHHSRAMSSAHFERAERENARAESAEAEVVTLRARLAAVEDLHWKVGGACSHCSQRSDYAVAWPCETAVALAVTTGEGE